MLRSLLGDSESVEIRALAVSIATKLLKHRVFNQVSLAELVNVVVSGIEDFIGRSKE